MSKGSRLFQVRAQVKQLFKVMQQRFFAVQKELVSCMFDPPIVGGYFLGLPAPPKGSLNETWSRPFRTRVGANRGPQPQEDPSNSPSLTPFDVRPEVRIGSALIGSPGANRVKRIKYAFSMSYAAPERKPGCLFLPRFFPGWLFCGKLTRSGHKRELSI